MIIRAWLLAVLVFTATGCSDSNNVDRDIDATTTNPDADPDQPMTTVDAASLLLNYVTQNVTSIRVTSSGEGLDTPRILTREQATSFSVPTAATQVEMALLTAEDTQIGVIIFEPAGEEMTLTLPGDGLSPAAVLDLDIVINADVWDDEPRILAGGLGFSGIIGVPGFTGTDAYSEQVVLEAGGTWNTLKGCGDVTPAAGMYTSAQSISTILAAAGPPEILYGGGMPVEFSWPVLYSTVEGSDFLITFNDYSQAYAEVAVATPNYDYNERAVVVLFGQLGNRLLLDDRDVLYPVRIEVVDDGTPMMMVAPDGSLTSAVGLYINAPGSPYHTPGNGPRLTAAKVNVISRLGDEGPPGFDANSPNDGIALYGDEAEYRLRVFTTGGYTPDGVTGLKPSQYDNFFQVQVKTDSGEIVQLENSGTEYVIDGNVIEVIGLAELGPPGQVIDGNDCYAEDRDNQIDIILKGDEATIKKIVGVRVPSQQAVGERTDDGYWQFYNPGGPGNNPFPGTTYSQGSPDHTVPVTIAIDDPQMVTYIDLRSAEQAASVTD